MSHDLPQHRCWYRKGRGHSDEEAPVAGPITPNLWFDDEAEEAAVLYCSVFPNSRITNTVRYTEAGPGPAGSVVTVEFELDGQAFVAINGGPAEFAFNESISFLVPCETQAEVDRYWDARRATEAMLSMVNLDVAALQATADGAPV